MTVAAKKAPRAKTASKTKKTPVRKTKAVKPVPEEITIDGVEYILTPKEDVLAEERELAEIAEKILEREEHLAVPFDKAIAEILGEEK